MWKFKLRITLSRENVTRFSRLMCFVMPALAIIWRSDRYVDLNPNPQDLTAAIMCAVTVLCLLLSGLAWSCGSD
jgi:hypothetical protein